MKPTRLGRWVVPATVLSLAAGALVLLVSAELVAPVRPQAWSPRLLPQADAAVAGAPRYELGGTPAFTRPRGLRELPGQPEGSGGPRPPLALHPILEGAGGAAACLARVEGALAELRPPEALDLLLELLEAPASDDPYEAETFRLGLLARVAAVPGVRAERALQARLDPERPRAERLLAVELLSTRREARTEDLELIASADHDLIVQRRARWALERLR